MNEQMGGLQVDGLNEEEFSNVSAIENNEMILAKDYFDPLVECEKEIKITVNIPDERTSEIKKKKRKKEDLDETPLPIFDCIYCSNEKVVFDHMSREIISERFLYNTSHRD